jgi:hypothetical protein
MIALCVLLCERRHCVRAMAYTLPGANTLKIEAQVQREAPAKCPHCGGAGITLEHSDSGFADLTAAAFHVAKLNGARPRPRGLR